MTLNVPINEIIIGERQRIDLGDLSDLESMSDAEVGQILPIIVDTNMLLIDGRRRLEKAKKLGWANVRVEVQAATSEISKQKKELFADIGRKDRTWQEKVFAVTKLHRLIASERADEGAKWTVRNMASFTGLSKTGISNMLRVASEMERRPEIAASCASFDEALNRLVIEPSENLALEELNRRKAEATQPGLGQTLDKTDEIEGEEGFLGGDDDEPIGSTVEPINIQLWGFNAAFSKPLRAKVKVAIAWMPTNDNLNIQTLYDSLEDDGCAVLWVEGHNFTSWLYTLADIESAPFVVQPWPLVWSKITISNPGGFPFSPNYNIGIVLIKTTNLNILPKFALNPNTSVMSCLHSEEDSGLPLVIVNWTLTAISQRGDRILLPCNAPVVAVADCGNVPYWFEADKTLYDEKMKALTEHYQQAIPGCVVKQ